MFFVAGWAFLLSFSVHAQTLPYQDPSLSFHERAKDLVSRLSLEEKASQMGNMVDWKIDRADYSGVGRVSIPIYQYWNEALHGVARSGAATSFPESKAMSATWDRQLVFDCATAISDEARVYHNQQSKGLNYWCPTINMSRDPRWGRDEENYGEDPFLSGTLAVEFIRGMQGEQTAENPYFKTVACAKHFAANNYERGRQGSTSFMREYMLREYYLPAFEMCVKLGNVQSIMSAYNAVSVDLTEKNAAGVGISDGKSTGGKPCAINDWLLTNILRDEWGFRGYVTSDCAGISCVYRNNKHKYFGDNEDGSALQEDYKARATALAIKAGNDINCEFKNQLSVYQTAVEAAIDKGYMTEADLDTALVRVLETRFALGEFDDNVPWRNIPDSKLECEAHQALALKAAQEAIVLLKNEAPAGADRPLLPLAAGQTVALIGPYANAIMLGDYSGTPSHTITPFQAFAAKKDFHVTDGTVQFEDYSQIVTCKRGEGKLNLGAGYIENTSPGDELVYDNVDFGTGCTDFSMSCAAKNTGVATISFYLDDDKSDPILSVENVNTGSWTKFTTVTAKVNPAVCKGVHKVYVKFSGSQSYCGNLDWFRFYNPDYNPVEEMGPVFLYPASEDVNAKASEAAIARAAEIAKKADVAIFLGGTNFDKNSDYTGTESHDRVYLTLPGNQEEVLRAVYEANPNTVLVLETNSSMDISWAKEHLPAILDAWYGGQAQGQAICDVLYGDVCPGGKLTSTWYNSVDELPSAAESKFKSNGMAEYNIDEWGYTYMYYGRSRHQKQAAQPMFPFGFGLSYTTFSYSNLAISSTSLNLGETATVAADITNTGEREGAEVVQLYVSFPGSAIDHRPTRKLVGFERVLLKPGETRRVSIPLPYEQLAYFNETTHTFEVEKGEVTVHLSSSSADDRLSGSLSTEAAMVKGTYLSDNSDGISSVMGGRQLKDGKAYNMQGVCVGQATDALAKGVYIIDGKKVVVE